MAPWEGIWNFSNLDQSSSNVTCRHYCGVLPTCSPRVEEKVIGNVSNQFTYTSADPIQCQAFCIEARNEDEKMNGTESLDSNSKRKKKIYIYKKNKGCTRYKTNIAVDYEEKGLDPGINSECLSKMLNKDIDPDVYYAYQQSLKKKSIQTSEENEDYFISTQYINEVEDGRGHEDRVEHYLRFDEIVFEEMLKWGWSRKKPVSKYIPICCYNGSLMMKL